MICWECRKSAKCKCNRCGIYYCEDCAKKNDFGCDCSFKWTGTPKIKVKSKNIKFMERQNENK